MLLTPCESIELDFVFASIVSVTPWLKASESARLQKLAGLYLVASVVIIYILAHSV